jgi:dihydrofolate reductase
MTQYSILKMIISFVVAADKNNLIGKDNQLPWHLPADLRFFKNLTTGHCIIMGRKTFDSLGRLLPNRSHVVITRSKDYAPLGAYVVHSIEDAVKSCSARGEEEVFIIGGAEIFKQAMNIADRIYLTRIHHAFEGDTWLPEFKAEEWGLVKKEDFQPDEKNIYAYSFCVYEKS